jgi:hypothetical protein
MNEKPKTFKDAELLAVPAPEGRPRSAEGNKTDTTMTRPVIARSPRRR